MLLYRTRKKVQKFLIENFNYYYVINSTKLHKTKEKIVYIDVSHIAINRYLYSFLKFFQLNNYSVFLPSDIRIINILCESKGEFKYASNILKEGIVKFGNPPSNKNILYITKKQLSNDYFTRYNLADVFRVPMSEYPAFYSNYRNFKIDFRKKRKNSLFMAGNMNPELYYKIGASKYFDILSRRAVFDYISHQSYYQNISSFQELKDYIKGPIDEKVIIVDHYKNFEIERKELKPILSEFNFFLALPGIIIPQCHNLIEAISVGCIPVIHKNYANILTPSLIDQKNSFLYCEYEELEMVIHKIFELQESELNRMRKEVLSYYKEFLSPKAIVETIEKNKFQKILIQAEIGSLSYLNIRRNTNEL